MVIPRINIKRLTRMLCYSSHKIATSNKNKPHNKKEKKKRKENEVNKNDKYISQPDLNQGCPDWKASVLTTTLTVFAGRDNYI